MPRRSWLGHQLALPGAPDMAWAVAWLEKGHLASLVMAISCGNSIEKTMTLCLARRLGYWDLPMAAIAARPGQPNVTVDCVQLTKCDSRLVPGTTTDRIEPMPLVSVSRSIVTQMASGASEGAASPWNRAATPFT